MTRVRPMPDPRPAPASGEAALAAPWGAGRPGPLRLEDGRALRVIFPGIPGGGAGPDYRDAILEAGGDLLRGDVEVHLKASGWRGHRHHLDAAYGRVVLHVVGENDTGALATLHSSGRAIAVLVLRPGTKAGFPPPFTPPCALRAARGESGAPALERLGLRRLRMKAARVAPLAARDGAPQALYALTLETLAGPANRGEFARLARQLPLAALLERVEGQPDRRFALAAELRHAAAPLALRRAGLRPMASPARRLEAAANLFARWWPTGTPRWPETLTPSAGWKTAAAPGIGKGIAVEIMVNAVIPVALASGLFEPQAAEAALRCLPSPGTYGRLHRLEGWLATGGPPFATAAALQGGLLLHAEYCARGFCGRCPLSS